MPNNKYDLIIKKIYAWDIIGARKEIQSAGQDELDHDQLIMIWKILDEYKAVYDVIMELSGMSDWDPDDALRRLENLPEFKLSNPGYDGLIEEFKAEKSKRKVEKFRQQVNEAKLQAEQFQYWEEARKILDGIKKEFPDWEQNPELASEILVIDEQIDKSHQTANLVDRVIQAINTGHPSDGAEALSELEMGSLLSVPEIERYRKIIRKMQDNQAGRSSRDRRDFIVSDDLSVISDIESVERSIASITAQNSFSFRILYNNKSRLASLCLNAISELGDKRKKYLDDIRKLEGQISESSAESIKQQIKDEISRIQRNLDDLDEKLEMYKARRSNILEELPKIEADAFDQIAESVDVHLSDAQDFINDGNISMAKIYIVDARNLGRAEKFFEGSIRDALGDISLQPGQEERCKKIEAQIADRESKRNEATNKKEAAQVKLSSEKLSLTQLDAILGELNEAKEIDPKTPGIDIAISNLKERITIERKSLVDGYKNQISSCCRKGRDHEARELYKQALALLGNGTEFDDSQKAIEIMEKRVRDAKLVSAQFDEQFKLTRDQLQDPGSELSILLEKWKELVYEDDLVLYARAERIFKEYVEQIVAVKERVARLEIEVGKGEFDPSSKEDISFLATSFLCDTPRVVDLLARYWLTVAGFQSDFSKKEEFLQEALKYSEKTKNQALVAKITNQLKELRDQSELGRQTQALLERLTHLKSLCVQKAMNVIGKLSQDDPVRQNLQISRLINDIEYEDSTKKVEDLCDIARLHLADGDYEGAIKVADEALQIINGDAAALKIKADAGASKFEEDKYLQRIEKALGYNAIENKVLSTVQIADLESVKILVDSLAKKTRLTANLSASLKQFTAYYQSWRGQVDNMVSSELESIKLLIDAGNFTEARQKLKELKSSGIPYDKLTDVNKTESTLNTYEQQSIIVDGMIANARDMVKEGKKGIDNAISYLTINTAKGFIQKKVDKELASLMQIQKEFGNIYSKLESTSSQILGIIEAPRLIIATRTIDLAPALATAKTNGKEIESNFNAIKAIGIKPENQTYRSLDLYQKAIEWYTNSVLLVVSNVSINSLDYLKDVLTKLDGYIETGGSLADSITDANSVDIPSAKGLKSGIEYHVTLLKQLKNNYEIFQKIFQDVKTYGPIGFPDPEHWQSRRKLLINVIENNIHLVQDEDKKQDLDEIIAEKQTSVFANFRRIAIPAIIIILIGLIYLASIIGPPIQRQYFPTSTISPTPTITSTPTMTLPPTLTPTLTSTSTPTKRPTYTPTVTITPSGTPMSLKVMVNRDTTVYRYAGYFDAIWRFDKSSTINILRVCEIDLSKNKPAKKELYGYVEVPNGKKMYGWILLIRTTNEVDDVMADGDFNTNSNKPLMEVLKDHLDLKLPKIKSDFGRSCPDQYTPVP